MSIGWPIVLTLVVLLLLVILCDENPIKNFRLAAIAFCLIVWIWVINIIIAIAT